MLRCIVFLLLFHSCSGKIKKESTADKNQDSTKVKAIVCYLVSLEGERKIYVLKNDSLYASNKAQKLNKAIYNQLFNPPTAMLGKDMRIGCGTCTDEVDFKFVFQREERYVSWIIDPNSALPDAHKAYFEKLIALYHEQIEKD